MKVLQVVTDTNIGGAGNYVVNLIKAAPKNEVSFKVVIPKGSKLKESLIKCNAAIIEAEGIADKSFSLQGVLSLIKIIRNEQPDIIHAHAGLSARLAARILGKKVVFTRHWSGGGKPTLLIRLLNNALCDTAIAVSRRAYDALLETGVSREKIVLLYNGIEPLVRDKEKKLLRELKASGIVTGIAARLEEVKNHKLLLESASKVLKKRNDIIFLIAGEGSLKKELTAYAARLGINDSVRFLGFISDMSYFMSALDINVLCSTEEAFPLSVLEAMSLGLPTIATACGGTEEQLENGVTGILTPNGDSNALANAILKLASNKDLRAALGKSAYKTYLNKFGAEKFASDMIKIYKNLIMEER